MKPAPAVLCMFAFAVAPSAACVFHGVAPVGIALMIVSLLACLAVQSAAMIFFDMPRKRWPSMTYFAVEAAIFDTFAVLCIMGGLGWNTLLFRVILLFAQLSACGKLAREHENISKDEKHEDR